MVEVYTVMKETAFAEKLRTSHGLTLGAFGDRAFAPDGKPYTVLQGWGGEDEAAEAFTQYCAGRRGWRLHWRCLPEIKHLPKGGHYFYMRLSLLEMAHANH
jgi:hypothetical protein